MRLRAQKEQKKKSPEAALAAFSDESVTNLSIVDEDEPHLIDLLKPLKL